MVEVFKCENCGARLPPPSPQQRMVVCEFCRNPRLNLFYPEPPPVAASPAAQSPAAPAPAVPGAVTPTGAPRSAEEILRVAHAHLQLFDELHYAPSIPAKKVQGARAAYGAMIPAHEPILVLFDSTFFGGADDGFVVTPQRLGWKNIACEPRVVPWEAFDAATVRATQYTVKVMGDEIEVGRDQELQSRLVRFLQVMGQASARPAVAAPAATEAASVRRGAAGGVPVLRRVAKPAPEVEETDDEEAATVAQWVEDVRGMAVDAFSRRASLHIAPNLPADKLRIARRTHADEMRDDDTIVVLYDPLGGGNDDGFAVTPWGIFWKNRGEDPEVAWWEDLDLDSVEYDEGVLSIDGWELRIADVDRGLGDELCAFIEAMVDWASPDDDES
jgi:hypothetical protein